MPSLNYLSFIDDLSRGNINLGSDTIWGMLVQSGYTPNQTTHTRRSDITNEASGTGYTSGGAVASITVTKNTGSNRVEYAMANFSLPNVTLSANALVLYKRRGGAASADELLCYLDFGGTITKTAQTFLVVMTTPIYAGPVAA